MTDTLNGHARYGAGTELQTFSLTPRLRARLRQQVPLRRRSAVAEAAIAAYLDVLERPVLGLDGHPTQLATALHAEAERLEQSARHLRLLASQLGAEPSPH